MMGAVYRGLGIGLLVLAAIGEFLPLLPSTPFLLLATGCFMRSSPEWNERLFRSRLFGQTLREWHTHRIVRPTTKAIAPLACSSSACFADRRRIFRDDSFRADRYHVGRGNYCAAITCRRLMPIWRL